MTKKELHNVALLQHIAEGIGIQTRVMLAIATMLPNPPKELVDIATGHTDWMRTLNELLKHTAGEAEKMSKGHTVIVAD